MKAVYSQNLSAVGQNTVQILSERQIAVAVTGSCEDWRSDTNKAVS